MPKIASFHLADEVIIEEATQKLSIIGSFATFKIETTPGTVKPFKVYLKLAEMSNTKNIDVRILSPSNTIISSVHYENYPENNILNVTSSFSQVTFNELGQHKIEAVVDGKVLESLPLQHLNIEL